MNSSSYIVHYFQVMFMKSSKQCSNCKRWFTTQKSFKHDIWHCWKSNCDETINDKCISAPNPLLSNFTPQVESKVFNQLNKTQSYEYEYDDYDQMDGDLDSNFYSQSLAKNNEELKEDMDDNTSLA
jgi:hypothetical protein